MLRVVEAPLTDSLAHHFLDYFHFCVRCARFMRKFAPTKTFKTTSKSLQMPTKTIRRLQIPKTRSLWFLNDMPKKSEKLNARSAFFPRASERRVLPIVVVCQTSSHLHIFTSSHLQIFSFYILTSSHLLIFTSSHLHILTSSHPLIFTSSHLLICASSHLLILTSSHLHIFSSSHLLILILTSSHLLIFTSSLLPSCSLALLLSPSFLFLSWRSWRRGAVPTRRHETQPFRTKWSSIAKNWSKIAICKLSRATPSHEMTFDRQKLR